MTNLEKKLFKHSLTIILLNSKLAFAAQGQVRFFINMIKLILN